MSELSSFETLVEDALYDRLATKMGAGGIYADPFYLQIQTFIRTAGEPLPQLVEQKAPFVWTEYVGGIDRGAIIGAPAGESREVFTIYGYIVFTPEILELTTTDIDTFVKNAKANAGVWSRRLRASLLGWTPNITCPVLGQKVRHARPTVYGVSGTYINELRREFIATIRWELELEP